MWSAVRLQRHRERLALNELARAGFETYCPRILHRRVAKGRKIETRPLLFPGYAFVAIVLQWYSAQYAPGVIGFLMDGERPARVPDVVIDELRAREHNGVIKFPTSRRLGLVFRSMTACESAPDRSAVCSSSTSVRRRTIGFGF